MLIGSISRSAFFDAIDAGPSYLNTIKLHTVIVMDHLSREIPVPMIFCSTWKVRRSFPHKPSIAHMSSQGFSYIINEYIRGLPGSFYIEKGDYQIINNNRAILPSKFGEEAKPDMLLEISIIIRKTGMFKDDERKCPKCAQINSYMVKIGEWIKWYV